MNILDVQAVFERAEPIANKSNKKIWIVISVIALIAVVAIFADSHGKSNRNSEKNDQL